MAEHKEAEYKLYFGDIHNHNAMGYGKGTLERSIEIARSHLDFFAFTGHSSWHDCEPMEGGRESHWYRGFERHNRNWDKIRRLMAEANEEGKFVAILGFEWHSSHYGDHCVLFPEDYEPLVMPDNLEELRKFCLEHDALMIPHHLANPQGRRGVNWEVFEESCSPIVEIFSEHGNSEEDRGLYPYFNHSFGGRVTTNTVRYALNRGLRFGFYASTDSHRGFPGAHGEGVMAVWAGGLDRKSLFEAFRARRTYGLTGDRIEVDFRVNGEPMGSEIKVGKEVEVFYDVSGRDEIDAVELIRDGRIVHRKFPEADGMGEDLEWDKPIQFRLEWGWGPWGDLALDRISDWEFEVELHGGKIHRYFVNWQSGPFDENRRHTAACTGENRISVRSFTSRQGAYRQNPNQSLVLEITGEGDAELALRMVKPVEQEYKTTLEALRLSGRFIPTGPFPKESMLLHRAVSHKTSSLRNSVTIPVEKSDPGYLYLRVRQKNGHYAWASPVFYNAE